MKQFIINLTTTALNLSVYGQLQNSNLPLLERLDYVLERYSSQNHIMGISVSVNHGNQNNWKGNHGISN